MRLRSVGSLFLLSVAAAASTQAETVNCTEITTVPHLITTPGNYCLKSSITVSTGGAGCAIAIGADDTTLDLNGHLLQSPPVNGSTAGVCAANRRNITVRNGTVRGFRDGVVFEDYPHIATRAEGGVVENMRIERSRLRGIWVQGRGARVRNNDVLFTGGVPLSINVGILVGGSGALVTDNRVLETIAGEGGTATGILVLWGGGQGSPVGATVERNFVGNDVTPAASNYGIQFYGPKGTAVGNRVFNMRFGIWFSAPGMYMDNLVGGATTPYGGFGTAAGSTNFSY